MKQKGEIITLFAFVLMLIVSAGASELREYANPTKCKTDNPDVKCEIYKE